MGKGARSKAVAAEKRAVAKEREIKQARQKKTTMIVCIAVVAALLIGVGYLAGAGWYRSSGIAQRSQIVMRSENFEVNGSMMSYLIFNQYKNYVTSYSQYLSAMSLDTSKNLRDQTTSDGKTWYQYFADSATSTMKTTLATCEVAKAAGMELTEEEIDAVKIRAKAVYNTGVNGKGVNEQDIIDVLKLAQLAQKYELETKKGLVPSAAQIEERYAKDPREFQVASYYRYTINYVKDGEEAKDGKLTEADARALAEKLSSAATVDDFKTVLEVHLGDIESTSKVDSFLVEDGSFTSGTTAMDWLFSAETEANASLVDEDNDKLTLSVYRMVTPAHRQEEATIAVRHILLSASATTDAAKAAARKEAESVYAQYQKNPSEATFIRLAMAYSGDGNYASGGIYEGVYPGQMVDSFNDWCFDEARKPGDTDIVDTTYGSHIMYFVGSDLPRWQTLVRDTIVSESYKEISDKISTDSITVLDALIADLTIQ